MLGDCLYGHHGGHEDLLELGFPSQFLIIRDFREIYFINGECQGFEIIYMGYGSVASHITPNRTLHMVALNYGIDVFVIKLGFQLIVGWGVKVVFYFV